MQKKQCFTCKQFKNPLEFGKDIYQKDGLNYSCKECRNALNRSRYKNASKEYGQKSKDFYWKDVGKSRLNSRKTARVYNQTLRGRYNQYKRGSLTKGLRWNLTLEDFEKFWQKPCYYCGNEIETIGLDRVDNKKGYIIKNLVPCCISCNKWKKNLKQKVFLEHCKNIVTNLRIIR